MQVAESEANAFQQTCSTDLQENCRNSARGGNTLPKNLEGRRLKGHCGRTPALRMLQAAKAHLVTEYHRTSLSLQSHSCFFDPVGLGVWVCDGGPFLLVVCLYGSV